MPIDEYTISSLTQSSGITNTDLMELATPDPSSETGYSSVSATVVQVASYMLKNILFASDLNTTDKTIIGAINEVLAGGGASIMYGTTAPTAQQGSNGNLYVQYTAGTGGASDTVDALYVKLDGSWCEIETGGGGSGGHTIVDDSGTSLTQRTNLQFKGAYSEDNSTDDTTEVNVVREMTKAEFDLLSDDEKTGLINITDITGGTDDRFQPVIYSEDEREIGVWIDGKPLYQRTLVISGTSLTAGQSNTINHGISDVDYIQLVNGTYTFGDGESKLPLPFSDNYKPVTNSVVVIEAISNSSIRIGVGSNYSGAVSPNTAWVTVQYTKTTDTAGSGQWTPQGVPAHHYSEDEQVVGTWIDGSTIYEKTFVFSQTLSCASNDWTNTDIPSSNIERVVSVSCFSNSGTLFDFVGANRDSSNYVQLFNTRTSAIPVDIVTLRYTKSST